MVVCLDSKLVGIADTQDFENALGTLRAECQFDRYSLY